VPLVVSVACRAFDLFARATQKRPGVINKEILEQALLQYCAGVATDKEIHQLIDHLPFSENAYQEFDYATHVSSFLP
jgi:hypothetical protein